MKKSNLRKSYLRKQTSLTKTGRTELSLMIKEKLFTDFDLECVKHLHCFHSIKEKNEVETSFIFSDLWREHLLIKTVAPRVNFEKDILEHLEINRGTRLDINHWGISEPVGDELVDELEIDLVLVPLLCFDKRGYRVGFGKGYYDKFLINCREDCLKIGVSFFDPVNEIADIKEFDVKLDYCITPEMIWEFE